MKKLKPCRPLFCGKRLITLNNVPMVSPTVSVSGVGIQIYLLPKPNTLHCLHKLLIGARFIYRWCLIKSPDMLKFLFIQSVRAEFSL